MSEEQAKYETLEKGLRSDLEAVMKKHGIRDASLCGFTEDDLFVGLVSISEEITMSGIFQCSLAIGRLWQHARGVIKKALDDCERSW